jgi:hypothetical protein
MRPQKWAIPAVLAILLPVIPASVSGYGNDGPGGGPHRRLNALALSRFIKMAANDPILRFYDFRPTAERYGLALSTPLFQVESRTVTKPGSWRRGEPLWGGVTSTFIEEGDVRSPFPWWVEEGGFTADEPESFMALRHFYDPLARGTDAETGRQAAYLTDALDAWISPLLMGHNPRMDAKTWATTESPFSFLWGRDTLATIADMDFGDRNRGREFGAVWRSLGETLHLLADMTVPAHVRNDAHPGSWIKKTLNGDPYEDYVDAGVVSQCAAWPTPEAVLASIQASHDPGVLFHAVALFTNRNFFSKDTISGRDGLTGSPVEPANGTPAYPAPKLEFYAFDPSGGGAGYYQTPNKTFAAAFRDKKGGHTVTSPTVTGQALALIPAAVEAEVKLIDMFMPRLRVIVDSFDTQTGILAFRAVRFDAGETAVVSESGREANLWSSPDALVLLTAGRIQRTSVVRIEAGGKSGLALNLSSLLEAVRAEAAAGAPVEASCIVGLDMGGILVKSETFGLGTLAPPLRPTPTGEKPTAPAEPLLDLLQKCVGVTVSVYGKFPMAGDVAKESLNEFHGGNFDFLARQKRRFQYPLRWDGTRFRAAFEEPSGISVESVEVSGEVSADGRTLISLVSIRTLTNSGGGQKETVRLTQIPFENMIREANRREIVFRSDAAASASAEYVNTVKNDPLRYYNWTASTGDGRFERVRIWFRD